MNGNRWLITAAVLSGAAALLHFSAIIGGPDWYRFFGAGEEIAVMAEQGSAIPALLTSAIAAILALWAAYALSGAGVLPRFPLIRLGLCTITAIYLLRGMALFPLLVFAPQQVNAFAVWSSLIVLVYGIVHAIGTWQAWPRLSAKN